MRPYRIMHKNVLPAVLAVVGLGFGMASVAKADLAIVFNSNATLEGTITSLSATTATMDIVDTSLSTMEVLLQEIGGPLLGITSISNYNADGLDFDVSLHLDLIRSVSGVWSATGTFSLTDIDTSTAAIFGSFSSSSIALKGGTLEIEGGLSGNPLLDNRPLGGPSWTYTGEGGTTVTVPDAEGFDSGIVFALQFNTGHASLDSLFGISATYSVGKIEGSVVPAPAPVLLCMMGMGMIGWVKRRTL